VDTLGSIGVDEETTENGLCGEMEIKVCICTATWERRVSCFIEPSEAALATHESILKDKRTQEDTVVRSRGISK
jgi:hypothetical protein